jgi:hypothetical protein
MAGAKRSGQKRTKRTRTSSAKSPRAAEGRQTKNAPAVHLVEFLRRLGYDEFQLEKRRTELTVLESSRYVDQRDIALKLEEIEERLGSHPLDPVAEWIESRTGISQHDVAELARRLGRNLGAEPRIKYGPSMRDIETGRMVRPVSEKRGDLRPLEKKIRKLDHDGTTADLLRDFCKQFPTYRRIIPEVDLQTTAPFIPTALQKAILDSLNGRALTKQALANAVCKGDAGRLYRHGDLKELRDLKLVAHKNRVGFFRPDAPPK